MPISVNGKLQIDEKYANLGQRIWYCTTNGGGTGVSWDSPTTLRTAIANTDSSIFDYILVGPGTHDLDNGSDATGTTLSTNYNKIIGISGTRTCSILANNDGSPTKILTITGDCNSIENIQTLTNSTTHINIQGSAFEMHNCFLYQTAGATGTGILIDNNCSEIDIINSGIIGFPDYGIRTNGVINIAAAGNLFGLNGVGLAIDGTNDSFIGFGTTRFINNTTGISISGTNVSNLEFQDLILRGNTTNVSDTSTTYNTSTWEQIKVKGQNTLIYPLNQGGVDCDTGDGVWTWTTNSTTIIPASTIITPFIITSINLQDYDASQIYQIQLFYGESTANIANGVYEFTVGAAVGGQQINVALSSEAAIPANSIVGAKVTSSTDGVDTITISLSYREI